MINLLLLLFFGMLLSFLIKKDFEEVFPPFIFTLLLGIYGLAILKKSHHAFLLSLFAFAAIWLIYIIREKRLLPSLADIKEKFTPLPVGFLCYVFICLVMLYCYHNHFVLGWDDFHYNATFPKDMYYYGTMPVGVNSATSYKDYLPLLQLFYYWGFQGLRAFSEPLMFQYKIILIYTCMLPVFHKMNVTKGLKRICIFALAAVLPYISLIEIVDSLSMDALMASIFGYAVIMIVFEKKRDWFCYYRILTALLALLLVKTIAAMFVGICLGIWLFTELCDWKGLDKPEKHRRLFAYAFSCVAVLGAYLSWKLFCMKNGNSTYLKQKLAESMNTSGGIQLPEYGRATLQAIMKSLFTLKLNFGDFSLTVAGMLGFVIVLLAILIWKKKFTIKDFWCYLILLAGLAVYVAFLCYTYLFIFEPWEAESLSSLDRYFGTYVLTMMYVLLYHFMIADVTTAADKAWSIRDNWSICAVTLVILATLNYPLLFNSLVPSAYMKTRANSYSEKMRAETETAELSVQKLEMRKMLVVNNTGNDVYSRTMDYCMIPIVTEPLLTTDFEKEELPQALLDKVRDRNLYYVYFTEQLGEDPDFSVFDAVVEDGSVKSHVVYYYNADINKLTIL